MVVPVTDPDKALAYYQAAATASRRASRPAYVPSRVRVTSAVCGDGPFRNRRVLPGDYDCTCNPYGAVSVTASNGGQLGLRLDEFEPIAWIESPASAHA